MAQHAFLSASGAERWMQCSPSARLEENFPDSTSTYASEGTLAHELAEAIIGSFYNLIDEQQYFKELARIKADDLYSTEMDHEVQKFVDYVKMVYHNYKETYNCEPAVLLETRLDFSKYVPEGFGTGDVIIIADSRLAIIDLKYGKGVRVQADNNPQIRLYGVGALHTLDMFYDIDTLDLTIMQPRLNNISVSTITAQQLNDWCMTHVVPAAKRAWEGVGKLRVGKWCKFCKVKPRCTAIFELANRVAVRDFEDPFLLNDDEVLEALEYSELLKTWLSAVKEYVISEAKKGKQWSGYKLVQSRGRSTWTDTEKVKQTLEELDYADDQILNTKVKSISDIKKLMSVDVFNETMSHLVHKPQGKPVLTDSLDPRPNMLDTAKTDFDDSLTEKLL
jgi:hypothetical protein